MTNEIPNANGANGKPAFDLEERTALFGETVIRFAKNIPKNPVTIPLISQIVRSSTSVAANYCEADDAVSKKDFQTQDRDVSQRSAGNKIMAANGCRRRTGFEN